MYRSVLSTLPKDMPCVLSVTSTNLDVRAHFNRGEGEDEEEDEEEDEKADDDDDDEIVAFVPSIMEERVLCTYSLLPL